MILLLLIAGTMTTGQTVPEYMYYKFNTAGDQQNFASAPVGTNPAVLNGLATGPTGQFGDALIGNGATSGSNRLNTGWATNLPSSGWTIAMWLNNFPATSSTTYYYFGDVSAQSFRCFTGGVAGNGNLLLRGTGFTDVPINGLAPGPIVIHLVYTGSEVKVFKNGVFSNTVAQGSVNFSGAGPFLVGGYSTSNSFSAGTLMDEFRMYNRPLSDAEVLSTWNQSLPLVTGPTVVTLAATAITNVGATLNGTVNANNASTAVTFEYGLTTSYGSVVAGVPSPVTGTSATPVSASIAGLQPNTTYHFRVVGVNANGSANGNDMTFTTAFSPPVVVTTAATAPGLNGATLNGTVNASGASTAVSFQYGTTVAYGLTATAVPSPVTGTSVTPVSAAIAGLTPNTLYHFRVVGTNSGGTSNGNDMTFTTAGPPVVTTMPPSNVNTTSATLNGNINANNLVTTVSFNWGLTTAYGTNVPATPGTVSGTVTTPVSANIAGLTNGVTYHYQCVGVNAGGTVYGADAMFTAGCPATGPAGPITGASTACQGATGVIYSTAPITNATGYTWTVPTGGTITAGANTTTITVSYSPTASSGNVTVTGVGTCGSGAPSSLPVTVNTMPVPVITGPAVACENSTGNVYATQAGMTGYTWTVSSGGTVTAGSGTNSITVSWSTIGARTVTVNYANSNGCIAATATSYAVTVNARPAPTITGNNAVCQGTSVVYTTQSGMTNYAWSVSAGGIITAGGTSTSNVATVLWNGTGAQTVSVNYTNAGSCSAASPVAYAVTVNPTPVPVIGSGNNPCVNSTNNVYYTESGMTNYVWAISPGGVITSGGTTSTVHVSWNVAGLQWISVSYTNATNCTATNPTQLQVFVNPVPAAAGPVTGTAAVCAGTNGVAYSCDEVFNATSYTWVLPAGATIATGAGTRNITVNFSASAVSGSIKVAGNNECGNGPFSPSFAVTVNPLPAAAGAITGPASVCAGATGVAYSVPVITGATAYAWTVPAGAVITSGATTRNILVTFGTAPLTGTITVKGTNACGEGAASPPFSVTVNEVPAAPVVTVNGTELTSSAASGNQWYYEGTAIPGATGQTYTVVSNTGYYWCTVTINGCTSPVSNMVWVVITGMGDLNNSRFKVYPVPNDGLFTVSLTGKAGESFTIQVFNQIGTKIVERRDVMANGTVEEQIDLRPVASGIYSVVILNGDSRIVRKVLINR